MFDAAARVLVYIYRAQHRIVKRTFEALRKLLLAYPEISPAGFKAALRDQWTILALDEGAAIEALPALLPADAGDVAIAPTCSRQPWRRPANSVLTESAG